MRKLKLAMNIKNKKILVTGGSGFIGFNLIKALKSLAAKVEVYDVRNGFDVTNEKQLTVHIKKEFNVIYHLAGFSGSERSNKDRLKSFEINTFATASLCSLISKYSPNTKLILSSSRLEYGKPIYLPVDENHPTTPLSSYGLSKLSATQIATIFFLQNNLDVTIFRTSNTYGPHPYSKFKGYNVINFFIDLAKQNKVLTVFGSGQQLRDYIYIDDLIEAFILAIDSTNSKGKIYNLGFGRGIKLRDMTELIIQKVGKRKLLLIPWPKKAEQVETGSYITDLTKIKNGVKIFPED